MILEALDCTWRTRLVRVFGALLTVAVVLEWRVARAEDGSNEVCPAISVEADDVRDRYDDRGRWVHQLRLANGRLVEEIVVSYRDERAVVRTEVTPGHRRIARKYLDGDRVVVAECLEDGRSVGFARYDYDAEERLLSIDKRLLPAGARVWIRETTHYRYDADGQLVLTEVRDAAGRVKSRTHSLHPPRRVPIRLLLTAGGTYQSDTELFDVVGGLRIHREPEPEYWDTDPLEVELNAAYRFHRAAGSTSTDQTTSRLAVDYHDIVPRIALFSFVTTDRNLPVNLRLNLELAVLGTKLDIVPPRKLRLDVSFAPIWNFRSIVAPDQADIDETTSKLRGSLRARAGLHFENWSVLNTFEFLPTLYGEDVAPEDDFWHRTVVRDTLSFEVKLSKHLTFQEIFKLTWDSAMRAQAQCPDGDDPLCGGYAFSSTTALGLNLDW